MAKNRFTNIPDTRLTAIVIIVFLLASNAETEVRNPSHAVWKSTGRSNLVEEDECCAASYFQIPNSQVRPERMAFLLGAQKSGTTFLFDELTSRHPFIVSKAATAKTPQMLETKESRYFHRLPIEDLKTFLDPFAMSG
ncbi:hypothetical protein CEUSTIGMA_g4479.t1 [Chlamydomonas eustigma]|uniref:Sulfotransferase n=1 Tax=Chlamydomonas eustigma TaxID=1157962 RepID=A0A250X2B0_9CHLO|nr:hypothetical protein CEUSTIGMA_g4479.t1 [Chlamydomonas eustigma]|eukprot:GAX77032.1 hypothetical protein CEUSTIGMA_g4479.t1 [Chlamydomonas eustigma]